MAKNKDSRGDLTDASGNSYTLNIVWVLNIETSSLCIGVVKQDPEQWRTE